MVKIYGDYKPSIEWAEKVIKGCNLLIDKRYSLSEEEKELNYIECPFGYISTDDTELSDTDLCPWLIFTKHTCNGQNQVTKSYDWVHYEKCSKEENIARLKGWIKLCEEIIKEITDAST